MDNKSLILKEFVEELELTILSDENAYLLEGMVGTCYGGNNCQCEGNNCQCEGNNCQCNGDHWQCDGSNNCMCYNGNNCQCNGGNDCQCK